MSGKSFHLVRSGLVWSGLVSSRLVWSGLEQSGLEQSGQESGTLPLPSGIRAISREPRMVSEPAGFLTGVCEIWYSVIWYNILSDNTNNDVLCYDAIYCSRPRSPDLPVSVVKRKHSSEYSDSEFSARRLTLVCRCLLSKKLQRQQRKNSSGEEDPWEDRPTESHLGGWSAVVLSLDINTVNICVYTSLSLSLSIYIYIYIQIYIYIYAHIIHTYMHTQISRPRLLHRLNIVHRHRQLNY